MYSKYKYRKISRYDMLPFYSTDVKLQLSPTSMAAVVPKMCLYQFDAQVSNDIALNLLLASDAGMACGQHHIQLLTGPNFAIVTSSIKFLRSYKCRIAEITEHVQDESSLSRCIVLSP